MGLCGSTLATARAVQSAPATGTCASGGGAGGIAPKSESGMRFSELCASALGDDVRPIGQAEVRRVVLDSRRAQPGDCFVAVRGTAADGHRYIAPAVAAGCTAVVCEEPSAVPEGVACAVVADARQAAGRLAQAIHHWPARRLKIVGVTGTNGKTTFTYLLRAILSAAGCRTGLVGTIAYETLDRSEPAGTTTPGPVELAEMMSRLLAAGGTHLVMELSSHALDQGRTAGIEPDVGVFTNLSGDHLDYHGTMERYLASKRRLFEELRPGAWAVLNRDDPRSEELASATRASVLWYGLSPAADVYGRIGSLEISGSRFALCRERTEVGVRTPLIGRHNVVNCLAAAAAASVLGVDLQTVAAALARFTHVPGRLQRVEGAAGGFEVLVDYAHTDDALHNVLSALRPVTRGRLIVVFGCGGDRDRSKRPRMARAAEMWADEIVVTSDNPRSEPPEAIIEEILAGFSQAARAGAHVQPDRRRAIAQALRIARAGDVVLIAGKGHETYQVIGDRRVHFDDVETAGELLRELGVS